MFIINNVYYKAGDDEERQISFFVSTNAKNKITELKKKFEKVYREQYNTRITQKVRKEESYQKDVNDKIQVQIERDSELANVILECINLDFSPKIIKYKDWSQLSEDCSFDFSEMSSTQVNENVEPIDGLASLLELFDNDKEKFFRYIVKTSYFFASELVEDRHEEILQMIENGKTIPARLSTVKKDDNNYPYYMNKDKTKKCENVNKGDTNLYYSTPFWDDPILICIDGDNNKEVRRLIQYKYSNHKISTGKTQNTMSNFTISHIWGYAFNPIFFTNLWNIAIVPTFCNFVFDKEESNDKNDTISYVNRMMKAFFWQRYNMDKKIEIYATLGLKISQWTPKPSKDDLENLNKIIKDISIQELDYSDHYCKYIYLEHPIDDKKIRLSYNP